MIENWVNFTLTSRSQQWQDAVITISYNFYKALESILKNRDITLPTKVCLVKAMVFPVVMYGCESWTIKKLSAEELMILNCGVGEDSWESLGLKRLVGLHRIIQLQLFQHYWLGHRLGLPWMVCFGNEQRSFCGFWDCIQVLHFKLLLTITATPFLLRDSCPQ